MKENLRHIRTSHELALPLDQLQTGDEILLSEMQRANEESTKQFCTSQITMVLEKKDELYGLPAIVVSSKSRVGDAANSFPKEAPFIIPLEEDGTIDTYNGVTIVTLEDDKLVPSIVDGSWSRLKVFRPEQDQWKQVSRRAGRRALLSSLFLRD